MLSHLTNHGGRETAEDDGKSRESKIPCLLGTFSTSRNDLQSLMFLFKRNRSEASNLMQREYRSMDEERIRRHAYQLWEEAGKPNGRDREFWERAKELAAIEENQSLATKSRPATGESATSTPVEPPEAIENQGDFPGMADQGEEQPHAPRRRKRS